MRGEFPPERGNWGAPTKAEEEASKEFACRNDLQCWGDKHQFMASATCEPLIERMAKYSYEWTDGWLGSKFDRFMWKDRKTGELAFFGNKIRFQNAFGAWQNMSYTCEYDPAKETVRAEVY